MWSKRQHGMTLVELIIAMVIIAVSLAGVLGVLSRSAIISADPMVTKQLTALAEGMMEEILLKPFGAPAATAPIGCARNGLASVGDYNLYNESLCKINGDPSPLPAGYRISVAVAYPAANDPILGGVIPQTDALKIAVTVTNGGQQYILRGWRMRYG